MHEQWLEREAREQEERKREEQQCWEGRQKCAARQQAREAAAVLPPPPGDTAPLDTHGFEFATAPQTGLTRLTAHNRDDNWNRFKN